MKTDTNLPEDERAKMGRMTDRLTGWVDLDTMNQTLTALLARFPKDPA